MCSTFIETTLKEHALNAKLSISSLEFAQYLDSIDILKETRRQFHYPKNKFISNVNLELVDGEAESLYFSGNSLGLCPKEVEGIMQESIVRWQERGFHGQMNGKYPWAFLEYNTNEVLGEIVGAKPTEVSMMGTLTANLHFLMISFYDPTPRRHKIIMEHQAFISDHVAVESQLRLHGYNTMDSLVLVKCRPNEGTLRTEDILDVIEKEGDETALVLFGGVQYYTGQKFDMKSITEAGHKKGCKVGFDLAHAVGNVELSLHEWDVDFACWCSYKYLNSGPGATAGVFLHEKYANDKTLKKLQGWWGVAFKERFVMNNENLPMVEGVNSYHVSNIPVFSSLPMLVSLQMFHEVGFKNIIKKQILITGYLEYLIYDSFKKDEVSILTPKEVEWRGSQLSLVFPKNIDKVYAGLHERGVTCDVRRPDVIRVAPAPLYNTYCDVYNLVKCIKDILKSF